jgi:hypothetical protein
LRAAHRVLFPLAMRTFDHADDDLDPATTFYGADAGVLYGPRTLQMTAFFGGPFAAGLLFARNYATVRRGRAALLAVAIGLFAHVALLAASFTYWGMLAAILMLPSIAGFIVAGRLAEAFRPAYTDGRHRPADDGAVVLLCIASVIASLFGWFAIAPYVL